MPHPPALKASLKRGAFIAAANWPLIAVQFIAEGTLKLLLAVPVVGGILLVVLLLGADVEDVGAARTTDRRLRVTRPRRIDLGDLHGRALFGEQLGNRPAHAGTASGDHRDLAVELLVPVMNGWHIGRSLRHPAMLAAAHVRPEAEWI